MGTFPFEVPQLTSDQIAQRLCALFPPNWASASAKSPGGIFYSVMESLAGDIGFELGIPSTQEITLGGVLISGDRISLTFTNPNIAEAYGITDTVQFTDTLQ